MTRYALIVGINEYKSEHINSLECAVSDAMAIKEIFSLPGKCQIPQENLKLLLNETATRNRIIEEIHKFQRICEEDDLFIFYYAGHGCSAEEGGGDEDDKLKKYLTPVDTDVFHLNSTAIDFSMLSHKLNEIRSKQSVMLFDCCYSGAAGGRTFHLKGSRANGVDIGLKYLEGLAGAGRLTMTACSGRQVAKESIELGHGVFTHYLLKGLEGAADFYHDGFVDIDELWLYVREQTSAHTDNMQHPVRSGWTRNKFFLSERQTPRIESTPESKAKYKHEIIERFSNYKIQDIRIADNDDISSLGKTAADYLQEKLKFNSKIAVSCGRTLIETISHLPRLSHSGIKIFPLNGSPSSEVHITDSMVLSYLLWSKFEPGKAKANVVPTGVPEELFSGNVKEGIKSLAEKVLSEAKESDIFLFGIGDPFENKNIPYLLKKANMTEEELRAAGAVGEINFLIYDAKGALLSLSKTLGEDKLEKIKSYNSKFFSLSPEALVEITGRPGIEMIVVAGGAAKKNAILAGIYGGYIRTLITDIYTAHWLAHDAPKS
jgi:DNA-binding transcriptional regulator LsrR (DeoR family)/uncharacterized caspase-like protein